MLSRIALTLLIGLLGLLMLAACGGSGTTTSLDGTGLDSGAADATAPATGLPGLPTDAAPRSATMSDGAVVGGDTCIAQSGAVIGGGIAELNSSADPYSVVWAMYQFPEPATPAYTLGWEVTWYDPEPYSSDPRDGYWVAYGNYDTDSWEFAGPFTEKRQRVYFPEGVDIVNGGGDIAVVFLTENGNRADVGAIQLGEDAGYGYEELFLGQPVGSYVGEGVQAMVDPADIPHVIYRVSPTMMDGNSQDAKVRWAYLDGTEWVAEDLDLGTTEEVRWFRGAVGSNGLRAVLVKEQAPTDDLHLYYDDGTGFSYVGVVTATSINESFGDLTFVNSTDDPTGDLDLLLITYCVTAISPDVQTHYETYDGVALSGPQILYPLVTQQSGRVSLETGINHNGVVGVPQEVVGDWEYHVGLYNATMNVWEFMTIPAWTVPLEPEWDNWSLDYKPDFMVRQAANGDYVVGYVVDDDQYYQFGAYDGVTWESGINDQIPTMDLISNLGTILDVYSSGTAATLSAFGTSSPQLFFGAPGSATPWHRTYLNMEPWSFISGDLAIDSGNGTHMFISDFVVGGLQYYYRDAISHDITQDTVDIGGNDFGIVYYFAHGVLVDGIYYLFYTDGATGRVLMSALDDGVMLYENEPITEYSGDWPLYILGAGYLEDSGLFYAAYLEYLSMSLRVVSGHPDLGDWETHTFQNMLLEYGDVTDNESEIGVVSYTYLFGEGTIGFTIGDPRGGPYPVEPVTISRDHIEFPFHLAWNSYNGQWCVAANDDDDERANYFLRSPDGAWIGPFLVCQELGSSAELECGGININEADGTVRISVMTQADGDPNAEIWVYSAPNGSAVFTPTQQLMTIDTITTNFDMLWTAPNASGEPVVAVFHRPSGDPNTDVRYFAPSGTDTWSNIGLWDTPIDEFYPDILIDETGGIYFAAIEMDGGNQGKVLVRYPW